MIMTMVMTSSSHRPLRRCIVALPSAKWSFEQLTEFFAESPIGQDVEKERGHEVALLQKIEALLPRRYGAQIGWTVQFVVQTIVQISNVDREDVVWRRKQNEHTIE